MEFWAKRRQEAAERHRKRIVQEEILSWVVFGLIVVVGFFVYQALAPLIERIIPMVTGLGS
jgi:hypothetical protein